MASLTEQIEALLKDLRWSSNPSSRACNLKTFVAITLRNGQITLYEAYLLQGESLTFARAAYTQLAWHEYHRVGISTLLALLNMKMMSVLFQDEAGVKLWNDWALEAYQWLKEKRTHYLADDFPAFLNADKDLAYCTKLQEIRSKKRKSFNKGPYHDEDEFPYRTCAYETMLLNGERFPKEQQISDPIADLLTEICLLDT